MHIRSAMRLPCLSSYEGVLINPVRFELLNIGGSVEKNIGRSKFFQKIFLSRELYIKSQVDASFR